MEFSHRKHYYMKIYNVIEIVRISLEKIEKCYIKRQWSQLHAQVDPKKCMKKMEGHLWRDICF